MYIYMYDLCLQKRGEANTRQTVAKRGGRKERRAMKREELREGEVDEDRKEGRKG
jgi:hypothetical protein